MHRSRTCLMGFAAAAALGYSTVPAQAAPFASSPSLSLSAQDVEAALRSAASSNRQLAAFYEAREYQPIWIRGDSIGPEGDRILDLVRNAYIDGLDPDDYHPDRIEDALRNASSGDPEDLAEAEIALSRALVAYVRDLHGPEASGITYVDDSLVPSPPSPESILEAAAAGRPFDQVNQMHPLYNQLRASYVAWHDRWGGLPEITLPGGPAMTLGARGDRVALLRTRLGLPEGTLYDKSVAAEVRAFKEAHGLPATAVADAQTIALLNQPRRRQEAQIRLNLQRARLLPSPALGRHIVVDAAAARLWMYDGAKVHDSMRVIVGKPTQPTPMLAALIRYAALNPYWNVPPDLVKDRIAPNVISDGIGYLDTKGYQVFSDWSDDAHPVDPATVDWDAVAAGREELPVRQRPGPANMMGAMKFMFPNQFGVYLHDTPDKGLFGEADRSKSSGCVRLEDARRVAQWLFGSVPKAPAGSAETAVSLDEPVPVYITYLTAAPVGSGIAFRDDIYGRDALQATRLADARIGRGR